MADHSGISVRFMTPTPASIRSGDSDADGEGRVAGWVKQLEYVLGQYSEYFHHERIHRLLDRIIEPKHIIDDKAEIVCIERLGGLLKSYHRLAA